MDKHTDHLEYRDNHNRFNKLYRYIIYYVYHGLPFGRNSPAIDAAPTAGAPDHDIAGNTRPYDVTGVGADGSGNLIDIGAYEETPPHIVSITPMDGSPTSAASVRYLLVFSEPMSGLSAGEFNVLHSGDTADASVTDISGYGYEWIITVSTGTGKGRCNWRRISIPPW